MKPAAPGEWSLHFASFLYVPDVAPEVIRVARAFDPRAAFERAIDARVERGGFVGFPGAVLAEGRFRRWRDLMLCACR